MHVFGRAFPDARPLMEFCLCKTLGRPYLRASMETLDFSMRFVNVQVCKLCVSEHNQQDVQ